MNETSNIQNQVYLNFFKNLQTVYDTIISNQEVVLFPMGEEGQLVMNLFKYTGIIYKVSCITAAKLMHINARQFFHTVPYIQFNNLPHMRNTAIFVVAVPKNLIADVFKLLKNFGCQNVIFIGDEVYKEMQVELQKFATSGQMTNWFFNYFYNKIDEMQYRIAEQNEVCAVNGKTFEPYRNKFRGKKIVIVATGPTAKNYKIIPDAIHIALNFAWKRDDISFNYLFTNDGPLKNFRDQMEQGFSKIKDAVFISKFMDRIYHCYNNYPEEFSLKYNHVKRFYIDDNINNPIYQDICYHPLMCCSSVVFAALHFSLFTYPKEIYLVGCDLDSGKHFYDNNNVKTFPLIDKIKVTYARMKMFAAQCYPETEIISINPVGLKGLFKDLYTD